MNWLLNIRGRDLRIHPRRPRLRPPPRQRLRPALHGPRKALARNPRLARPGCHHRTPRRARLFTRPPRRPPRPRRSLRNPGLVRRHAARRRRHHQRLAPTPPCSPRPARTPPSRKAPASPTGATPSPSPASSPGSPRRPPGRETECSAAAQLLAFRQTLPGFAGESFPAISGAGEHGAIIHYRAGPATDRPIRPNEAYLIDSGAQFPEGTTDITRTVWTGPDDPPPELAERATRVLAGNIALATLRFPEGVAGSHIDAIARRALWDAGLDFDHGTGHGVGSFLSVHEGPARISRQAPPIALRPA